MATVDYVAAIVVGAPMATLGVVWSTIKALEMDVEPFASALSGHLEPDVQHKSMNVGYDQTEEDILLEAIDWPVDGCKLFEIYIIAPSSKKDFFGDVSPECSWFAMPR